MMPGHRWLSKVADGTKIPHNALIVACTAPALICVLIWFNDGILVAVTSFAILGIYLAFQMVVLGALRQRARGWKPGGAVVAGRLGRCRQQRGPGLRHLRDDPAVAARRLRVVLRRLDRAHRPRRGAGRRVHLPLHGPP